MSKPGSFLPGKRGQVVIPVSPQALKALSPEEIADTLNELIISVARAQGGAPIGSPELLKADELLARTDDAGIRDCVDDAAIGSLFIVAEMIPAAQAAEIERRRARSKAALIEVVAKPVLPRGHRPRR